MGRRRRDHLFSPLNTAWPLLYCISGGRGDAELGALGAAAAAGVDLIQIREKQMSTGELLAFCRRVRAAIAGTGARLLLNDRLDVALAAGLDGVHLPAAGLPPRAVRRHAPAGFLIGRSCHSAAEVRAAEEADFCVLGPIFSTPSKPQGWPLGLAELPMAVTAGRPVLALGGITAENAAACLRQGAAGVAGIRLFQQDAMAVVASLCGGGTKLGQTP